jgi:hypothetical protein
MSPSPGFWPSSEWQIINKTIYHRRSLAEPRMSTFSPSLLAESAGDPGFACIRLKNPSQSPFPPAHPEPVEGSLRAIPMSLLYPWRIGRRGNLYLWLKSHSSLTIAPPAFSPPPNGASKTPIYRDSFFLLPLPFETPRGRLVPEHAGGRAGG